MLQLKSGPQEGVQTSGKAMNELEFPGLPRVIFGGDSIGRIAKLVAPLGKRILLVAEHGDQNRDALLRLQGFLRAASIEPVIFDDITPGARTSLIQTISDIGKAGKIQVVIGFGGMRVLSISRVAAAIIGGKSSLSDMLLGRCSESQCAYVEVPISCRNHFMLRNECIITDSVSERSRLVRLPEGMTRAVIIDPLLSMSLSAKYQLVALLDTLLAAIEAYMSDKSSFLSDIYSLDAVCRLQRALLQTFRRGDDPGARVIAGEGGLLSAMALSISGQGIGGTLAYMINSAFNVPKSWVAMVLLPHILDQYAVIKSERCAKIADALGEDISGVQSEQAAPMAAVSVRRILSRMDMPTRLRDLNLSLEDLAQIAPAAAAFPLNAHCGLSLDEPQIYNLIKKAF